MKYFNNSERPVSYAKEQMAGNMIKEWTSIREAAINNNISFGNIINCCKGRCKTCGGYIWKYNI